ncbi:MAG: AMP-binding protein [Actinobacteria bacterium]|nr:AMP-binding protein [Actinomycetota bacterium]
MAVITAASIAADVDRLARALVSRRVAPGDRVAALLPNGAPFFVAGLAAARCEATFLPINWHLKAAEVEWITADSAAKVLIDADTYEGLLASAPADVGLPTGYPSPALMFYTSGTTGRPKGVLHPSTDAVRLGTVQEMLATMWGFTADDVHLLCGPAYHGGPGGYAFNHLFIGATVVIQPTWSARHWLQLVSEHRVTTTFMTPAHFIRILEVPDEERAAYDVSSLRLIIHGAAPCPVDVKRRFIAAVPSAEVYELYGASEGGATRISSKEWLERPGSVGTPWPNVDVKVDDAGLIWIRPPGGVGFKYHNDPDKTAGAWDGEYFTVGDVGHLDDDGYLYITDRASDMVIRDGVNIYPREIENALHAHPAVIDCAVLGIPDPRHGEVLKAVVETALPIDAEHLAAHVRLHLADFKCPEVWEFTDQLPRDPSGKVRKRDLRATATGGAPGRSGDGRVS